MNKSNISESGTKGEGRAKPNSVEIDSSMESSLSRTNSSSVSSGGSGRKGPKRWRRTVKASPSSITMSELSNAISQQQGENDALLDIIEDKNSEISILQSSGSETVENNLHSECELKFSSKKEAAEIKAIQLIRHKARVTHGSSKQANQVLAYLPVVDGVSKFSEFEPMYLDRLTDIARNEIINSKQLLSSGDLWSKKFSNVLHEIKIWYKPVLLCTAVTSVTCLYLWSMIFRPVSLRRVEKTLLATSGVVACVLARQHFIKPKVRKLDRLMDFCCKPYMKKVEISGTFKRTMTPSCVEKSYPIGFTINEERLFVPRACSHNEEVALKTRQMTVPLSMPDVRRKWWTEGMDELYKRVGLRMSCFDHMSHEDEVRFISKMTSGQKRLYESAKRDAHEEILINPNTKMFVKIEAGYLKGDLSKVNPRCISGKSADYFFNTGPTYWLWTENVKKRMWSTLNDCLNTKYIYSGSLDAITIGMIISHYETLGWYAMEGDFSRYDGHNEIEALEAEFKFYEKCGMPLSLLHYFEKQLYTNGKSRTGHKFKTVGKVASGVANTSMGNTIRNFCIATVVSLRTGIDIVVIANGDDFIYFSKIRLDPKIVTQICLDMGHKLECIPRPDYDFIEYCSARAWDIGAHRVMGPKPFRTLGKTFIGCDNKMDESDVLSHIRGIAYGMRMFRWVPVLGKVLNLLTREYSGKVVPYSTNPYSIKMSEEIEVDTFALESQFEKIYGISQRSLENEFDQLDFNQTGWSYTSEHIRRGLTVDGCLS